MNEPARLVMHRFNGPSGTTVSVIVAFTAFNHCSRGTVDDTNTEMFGARMYKFRRGVLRLYLFYGMEIKNSQGHCSGAQWIPCAHRMAQCSLL
jgi:hypothetical protein